VLDKLAKRWPGVRITFGFADCSICKVGMDHPSGAVQALKRPIDDLRDQIRTKAVARLSIEKMEKDPKLVDPDSRYYNQPARYAMDCFAFYTCFKCNKFFFGGRRDCEQNAAAEDRPPEEFVCFDCADLKSVQCKNRDHSEFQVWKCVSGTDEHWDSERGQPRGCSWFGFRSIRWRCALQSCNWLCSSVSSCVLVLILLVFTCCPLPLLSRSVSAATWLRGSASAPLITVSHASVNNQSQPHHWAVARTQRDDREVGRRSRRK